MFITKQGRIVHRSGLKKEEKNIMNRKLKILYLISELKRKIKFIKKQRRNAKMKSNHKYFIIFYLNDFIFHEYILKYIFWQI